MAALLANCGVEKRVSSKIVGESAYLSIQQRRFLPFGFQDSSHILERDTSGLCWAASLRSFREWPLRFGSVSRLMKTVLSKTVAGRRMKNAFSNDRLID